MSWVQLPESCGPQAEERQAAGAPPEALWAPVAPGPLQVPAVPVTPAPPLLLLAPVVTAQARSAERGLEVQALPQWLVLPAGLAAASWAGRAARVCSIASQTPQDALSQETLAALTMAPART